MQHSQKRYTLRWRYDFRDRPAVYGMWGNPGNGPGNQAWAQNKEGLSRAAVEAKDLDTKEIITLAECDGHDFRNFQWMAIAKVPMNFKGQITPTSQLVGMKLLTTDFEISVFANGVVKKQPLPESEKKLHFATYGR